jgi:hypothetical protein
MVFNQVDSNFSNQDIRDMMTDDQINNFSLYAIVPEDPLQPLSKSNSVLITAECRKYLVASWKVTKDTTQYQRILKMPQFDINKLSP